MWYQPVSVWCPYQLPALGKSKITLQHPNEDPNDSLQAAFSSLKSVVWACLNPDLNSPDFLDRTLGGFGHHSLQGQEDWGLLHKLTREVFTSKEQGVLGVGLPLLSKQDKCPLQKVLAWTAEGNKYLIAYG